VNGFHINFHHTNLIFNGEGIGLERFSEVAVCYCKYNYLRMKSARGKNVVRRQNNTVRQVPRQTGRFGLVPEI
jgi:hypothetical protein